MSFQLLDTRKHNYVKLISLTEAPRSKFKPPITKDGHVRKFEYENWHTDKRPRVLYLGKWRHPRTNNMLIGGINLNKLNPKELAVIRSKLSEIYPPDFNFKGSSASSWSPKGVGSLKKNYDRLKAVAPWVITTRRYQTWDKKYIHSLTVDTLKFIDPSAIDNTADEIDSKSPAYADPQSMEKDLQGNAATQELTKKSVSPKEPAKKSPKPPGPQEPDSEEDNEPVAKKESQPQSPPPPPPAPPSPAQSQTPADSTQQEPELPNVPNVNQPGAGEFKVSASAEDIAKINNTKKVPTAGGTIKKSNTPTGNAVRRSGSKVDPKADSASASKIKRKKK